MPGFSVRDPALIQFWCFFTTGKTKEKNSQSFWPLAFFSRQSCVKICNFWHHFLHQISRNKATNIWIMHTFEVYFFWWETMHQKSNYQSKYMLNKCSARLGILELTEVHIQKTESHECKEKLRSRERKRAATLLTASRGASRRSDFWGAKKCGK